MSSDDIGAAEGPDSVSLGEVRDSDPGRDARAGEDEPAEVRFVHLLRARQVSPLPPPLVSSFNLSLAELDPLVLERLAAVLIKRRPNRGAHFYGRSGQEQHGLDIVERETDGTNSVYQVRRYQVLTPGKITSAVTEYADPKPPKEGGAGRRAGSGRAGTCCSPPRSSRPRRRCRTS